MFAVNVGNLISLALNSKDIREFILEKGLMSAVNVGNLFPLGMVIVVTSAFTPVKDPMSVVNVKNVLDKAPPLFNTIEFIAE